MSMETEATNHTRTMSGQHLDASIRQVERLYESVTGESAPVADKPYSPIPPEVDALQYVEEQVERLWETMGAVPPAVVTWAPRVCVQQQGEELVVEVEVPGIPREAMEVVVAPHVLTISGERAPVAGTHASERHYGAFQRSVSLPADAKLDALTAQLRDGVLEVRVLRSGAATSRVISIQ
jgi:HSP20 family protein